MASNDARAWVVQSDAGALRTVPSAPRLSTASCEPLREIAALDEQGERRLLQVPVERPLTLCIDGRELVTLMTLGAAPELLVLGYLLDQRLIVDVTAIESVTVDWAVGTAAVTMRSALRGPAAGHTASRRGEATGMACALGTAFGDVMRQGDAASLAESPAARVSRDMLFAVLETMRRYDAIHRAAGSVHSCALFRGERLWASIEDVSRHNGMDTIAGWMALHGIRGGDKILFTTGRLTGEMVMKAAHNGIPIMVSRNGVTAMGHDLAGKLGMTLFGRAANRRFTCYVGAERFDAGPAP